MPHPLAPRELATPWLVGYDAHGIQELITASNRPLAMLGASTTITRFDEQTAESAVQSVFSGGGRGIELVDGPAAAEERCRVISKDYAEQTFGGVVSAAHVPLDRNDETASLRWLRQRLDLVKDAGRPPGHDSLELYPRKSDQCADCGSYKATHPSAHGERVCPRCHTMAVRGRDASRRTEEEIQSLLELVGPGEYIAAVSLDGNNLGAFFDSLDSLAATQKASRELNLLFKQANGHALERISRNRVSLATGGDDIRLFLSQSQLLAYLDALIPALHKGADRLAQRPPFRDRFDNFGVGVGVVLADPHLPAKRLMEHAHELERSAKTLCHRAASPRARSALDFEVLTAGDASKSDPELRPRGDGRPIAFGDRWEALRRDAIALAAVPSAQLALLRDAPTEGTHEFAEFKNQWRYQVARLRAWQDWYDQTGRDWRDASNVIADRPRPVHLDLLHLV